MGESIAQPGLAANGGSQRRTGFPAFMAIAAATALLAVGPPAVGQVPPGQGGVGRPSTLNQPGGDDTEPTASTEKPDVAARKAYAAGLKSMSKARDYEGAAAAQQNPDKQAKALEKMGDALNRALDQFTEALSNKGDMVDAWNNVGYIHLRLGAYAESVDDYDHTLALKPDLVEAIEHRGEAYLGVDRLDDAKAAYMDLFNHDRPLADRLMTAMQQWMTAHRSNANGMRATDVAAFGQWIEERNGIAKQTAS